MEKPSPRTVVLIFYDGRILRVRGDSIVSFGSRCVAVYLDSESPEERPGLVGQFDNLVAAYYEDGEAPRWDKSA